MGAHYCEYFQWAGYAVAGLGAWRILPFALIRLVAAFTKDERRHKQSMEVLRLARHADCYCHCPSAEGDRQDGLDTVRTIPEHRV